MAQTTPISRVLQIQVQNGTAANGLPKVQNHNYANVSINAADDDILAVGQALSTLFSQPLMQIVRVDQVGLAPDASATSGTSSTATSTSSTTGA